MTTKEAAEYLNVSPRQVAHLCRKSKLEAKRHGYMWDIDPASVEAYKAAPKDKGGRPRKEQKESVFNINYLTNKELDEET